MTFLTPLIVIPVHTPDVPSKLTPVAPSLSFSTDMSVAPVLLLKQYIILYVSWNS